jgi:hypothetical protein
MAIRKSTKKGILKQLPKAGNESSIRKDYHPRFCNVVMGQGRLGKSRAQIATYLGITRKRLAAWETEHPDFREAMEVAADRALAYLEGLAMRGLRLKHFQSALMGKLLAARAPETYSDKIKMSGDGDAPLTVIKRVIVDPKQ